MDKAFWISIAALVISVASFINAWLSRRHSRRDILFNLRRETLLKAREIELEWQQILNEIYHFTHRVSEEEIDQLQKQQVIDYVDGLNVTFTESHKNASGIRRQLEENFDKISEKEAKRCLASFEGQQISLKASREEMLKKLSILAAKAKTVQFVFNQALNQTQKG